MSESEVKSKEFSKPGDNPNKAKAKVRTSKPGGPKNQPQSSRPVVESVDPLPVDMSSIDIGGIIDGRAPGQFEVGTVLWRHESLTEITAIVQAMTDAAVPLVHRREALPDMQHIGGFIINYCLAHQMFSTLSLNASDGPMRKMKALRLHQLSVPDFVPPLVHCFGHFNTSEGFVRVRAIETIIPNLVIDALHNYAQLPGVRPLPDFNLEEDTIYLFESTDFKRDFVDMCRMLHPQIFGPLPMRVAAGRTVNVEVDITTVPIDDFIDILDSGHIEVVPATSALMRAFLNLRDLTIDEFRQRPADVRLLDFSVGEVSTNDLAEWINIAIPEYVRVCYRTVETLFKCTKFTPSVSGTAAQFVIGQPDTDLDSVRASHHFQLSPQSASLGYLLVPSMEVTYNPLYSVHSVKTRYQHLISMTTKYVHDHLKA